MTNEMKNMPELRFPEFEGNWLSYALKDVKDPKDKYSFTGGPFGSDLKKSDYKDNGIRIIQLQNINDGNFNDNYKIYTSSEKADILKSCNIYPGDIVIAKMADPLARATILPQNKENRYLMASDAIRLKVDDKSFNKIFMVNYINSRRFRRQAEDNSSGSTRMRIGLVTLGQLKISSPNKKEQDIIGDFFSKLDRQIELEEQKLSLLEEQKKGYMQKIFSQELRFKDENGNDYPNWIFEELNNIFTKYQNTIYLHDNEEYKRISISNKGKITHRDITFGKRIGRKRQYLIDLKKHPNTLTFIRQGVFLGGIGFIPSSLDGYIVTENMPLLSMSEEYSKKFMTYLFSSESYYKSVIFKNLPTGSAQKALHEKDWLKSFVNIPVYSEQEKIGNFFEKQDNLIKKQSDKVELLKERKKGFLQKMFV